MVGRGHGDRRRTAVFHSSSSTRFECVTEDPDDLRARSVSDQCLGEPRDVTAAAPPAARPAAAAAPAAAGRRAG